jgi:D-alanyl-D-alanine carboxypeptidase
VSPVAASQSPSKMGFKPGTLVTGRERARHDDGEVGQRHGLSVLAEGVGGSVDGFSAMMNQTAQRLGMTQTSLRQSERDCRRTARSPPRAILRSSRAP